MSEKAFRIDPARSSRTKIDEFQTAVWVAVCSTDREALDDPAARQAAITWAQTRYKITGAIAETQGPLSDDGSTLPFAPGPDAGVDSGVSGIDTYRRMAAQLNVAQSIQGAGNKQYVLFVKVLANVF